MQAYIGGQPLYEFLRAKYAEQTINLAIKADRYVNYYNARWCAHTHRHRLRCIDPAPNPVVVCIDPQERTRHAARP